MLLDTDVFSFLLMKPGDTRAKLYAPHVDGKLPAISFITLGELYFWGKKRKWGKPRLNELKRRLRSVVIIPYDDRVCQTYAELKEELASKGDAVADNDLWIAACAVRHSIPLITNNRAHFEKIPSLQIISEAPVLREIQSQMTIEEQMSKAASASTEPEPPSSQ